MWVCVGMINFLTKGLECARNGIVYNGFVSMKFNYNCICCLLGISSDNWQTLGLYLKELEERGFSLFPKVLFQASVLKD